jgi:aldehyde:ferredoxin oxidoreductase
VDQTTDALYEAHKGCGVLTMGPGGENLVKFALAFTDKAGTLGRGGFGAVMGSKKLKAVAVRGSRGLAVADTKRFMETVSSLFERAKKYPLLQECIDLGIMQNWDNYLKALPMGEWPPEKIDELYGLDVYKKVKKERIACPTCFIADKDILELGDGEFAGTETYTHSYLAVALSGVHFGLEDYHEAVKLADTVNANGICQMTFEAMVSYLMDLKSEGVLTEENTMGLDVKGDFEGLMNLLDCITQRRGLGEVLAQGWVETINHFGEDTRKFTKLIKDQDTTFDPRVSGLGTMEFEQMVNPRGAQSAASGSPSYIPGLPIEMFYRHAERMGADKAMMERIFDKPGDFNVGRLTRLAEDWYTLFNALGVCNRHVVNRFYSVKTFAELYSAATGIERSDRDLMEAADRIWSLHKALNVREGFDRKDDTYPDKWFEPFVEGKAEQKKMTDYFRSHEITPDELNRYLNDYYDERGWDVQRGIPTGDKLTAQGLNDVARDLSEILP